MTRASTIRGGIDLAVVALLSGCASDDNRTPRAEQRWVSDGPEVSCINRNQIRGTNIPDSQTINFEMTNRRMFVNRLPNVCPGLVANRTIKINSRTTQVCSANTITILNGPGGQRGATCGLGRFQPVRREDVPATAVPAAPPAG
jgi:hypothetical protein